MSAPRAAVFAVIALVAAAVGLLVGAVLDGLGVGPAWNGLAWLLLALFWVGVLFKLWQARGAWRP